LLESGGYVVHPAEAAPSCDVKERMTRTPEMKNVQYEYMLSFGNAMSRAPIISGMQKLPNAPMRMGVIAQKIMIRPCIVKMLVYVGGVICPPVLERKSWPTTGTAVLG
jgi:hypothetical protein